MVTTTVTTGRFISDLTLYIRDVILTYVTDPIASTRPSGEKFVMTSYPQRPVTYPIITVRSMNTDDLGSLGMQSELMFVRPEIQIRIWARDEKEKDGLTQNVINTLRTNQFPSSSTGTSTNANLYDFRILSMTNSEEMKGEQNIKSKIITIRYAFILGG